MISVSIDGKDFVVINGLTIIDAARSSGIDIPSLGYDPRVSPPSNFEAAFVEVIEGIKTRFVSATSTPVIDGMVIRTQSEALQSYRHIYLQSLLRHHYGDCIAPCVLRFCCAARRISTSRSIFIMSIAAILGKLSP